MTRTQYYTATSADGFIADADNSLDWLFEVPHDADDDGWDQFIADVGVLALGATTYEWMLDRHDMIANPQQWHDFYGDRLAWVFTHRELPAIPGVDVHFTDDVDAAYAEMAGVAGERTIWIVGGGDLVGQFDDRGLLDEILLSVTPVFLGSGAPLLPRRITSTRCSIRTAHQVGQRVRIVLDVRPQEDAEPASSK
jgi:dihydrofolate reductase